MGRSNQDKNKLAANILSGQGLNIKNSRTPAYLEDNLYSTPVPKYVREDQLGISVNIFGEREALIDQIYKINGLVTPESITDQEVFDFLKEEFYEHGRMVTLMSNWDLHPYTDYQYPGQKAAIRKSSNQAHMFASTVVDFDFEKFKERAAKSFDLVSFENVNSFEAAVAKIPERYNRECSDHDIINILWHATTNLDGNPLKLSFTS